MMGLGDKLFNSLESYKDFKKKEKLHLSKAQLQQSDSNSKKTLVTQNDGTCRHLKYKIRSSSN